MRISSIQSRQSLCSQRKQALAEVQVNPDKPLIDLGKWIKLPEVPVQAKVDRSTTNTVLGVVAVLGLSFILVAAISKN